METLKSILVVSFVLAMSAGIVQGGECVVHTTADSGAESLRQCMMEVTNGDTITFDPAVFPPSSPSSIALLTALPYLVAGRVTIDAAGKGVVLNGSGVPPGAAGFVVDSDSNSIMGIEIISFPGGGIVMAAGADHNTLDGNLISGNGGHGVQIYGTNNTIVGNRIGTDVTGTTPMGNTGSGVYVSGAAGNHIGPGNTIAYNGHYGIAITGGAATGNTITQNSITGNALAGISLSDGGNAELAAPVITECTETSITGTAPPNCTIEVFSDAVDEGGVYEGMTASDGTGDFTFDKPGGLTGEYITATATDAAGNTSPFSAAASAATEPTTWGRIKDLFR